MNTTERSRLDELLDLLADEVARRLQGRTAAHANVNGETIPATEGRDAALNRAAETRATEGAGLPRRAEAMPGAARPAAVTPVAAEAASNRAGQPGSAATRRSPRPEPDSEGCPDAPESQVEGGHPQVFPAASHPPQHTARLLARLLVGLLAIVLIINIPYNQHGTALARSIPGSASLVIRNGLVVKEADRSEIYVYQNGKFRWISSIDAFQHFGYQWRDVHVVETGFLTHFEIGAPLHVLLKCPTSPHIYRLEGGEKRWIVDIPALEAEGHQWSDVQMVTCGYLQSLPMGETIPPGHGPAPEP